MNIKKKLVTLILNLCRAYIGMWKNETERKGILLYFLHYSALFTVVGWLVFLPFAQEGKTLIWTHDNIPQNFNNMVYISQTMRDAIQVFLAGDGLRIPLFNFSTGLDAFQTLGLWNFEPIQWLAVFWPWDQIDVLYDVLVVTRYYLVGAAFSVCCFYFKCKPLPIMAGAMTYTFCGFALYAGVTQPFFLAPMIFLPILLIGIDKVIKNKKPYLLILIVFISALSSVYFFCVLTLLMGIYILIRFWSVYRQNRAKAFIYMCGRIIGYYCIGFFMAAFGTIPVLYTILHSTRMGLIINTESLLHYPKTYYLSFLTNYISGTTTIGYFVCLSFSVVSIPAIIVLFMRREKEEYPLRIGWLLITIMLFIPAIGLVLSGFDTISNRWGFAYAFCVAMIVVFTLPSFQELTKKQCAVLCLAVMAYFIICILFQRTEAMLISFLMLNSGLVALLLCYLLDETWIRKTVMPFMVVLTIVSVISNANILYSPAYLNYISEFSDKDTAYSAIVNPHLKVLPVRQDDSFYRIGTDIYIRKAVNGAFFIQQNGLSTFHSTLHPLYVSYLKETENAGLVTTIIITGLDNRTMPLALASVKYYGIQKDDSYFLPYGFEQIDSVQSDKKTTTLVLENPYALPLGYTYSTYLSTEEYQKLSALARQEVMLQAVVLKNSVLVDEAIPRYTAVERPVNITESNGVEWDGKKLRVTKAGGTITMAFEGVPNSETYLRVVGLDLTSGTSTRKWNLKAITETTSASAYFSADAYLYSNRMKNRLLNLGYSESGHSSVTVVFPNTGTFILDDLQIWCQPMNNYVKQVEALREEILKDIVVANNRITGNIDLASNKILCLSIPYSEGWSATVNGEPVKLLEANTMYMAIELTAGHHDIELNYFTPGLKSGLIMSSIGMFAFIGVAWMDYKRRKIKT